MQTITNFFAEQTPNKGICQYLFAKDQAFFPMVFFKKNDCQQPIWQLKAFSSRRKTQGCFIPPIMSLVETQKLMRHSDPKTTAKYYVRLQEQQLIKKTAKYSLNYFIA